MKREKLWLIYVEKNPRFVEPEAQITFTAKGIRQFFERTYDIAYKAGADSVRPTPPLNTSNPFGDLFGNIFKK